MISEFNEDMDIISALSDTPGLPANELKAKFDEGGKALKEYINENLVSAVNDMDERLTDMEDDIADIPEIEDSLISDDALKALSAKQGKALNTSLSGMGTRVSSLESTAASHTALINGKQKAITSGSADPSGGADGDIYLKY